MEIAKIDIANDLMVELCDSLFSNRLEIKETCAKSIIPIKPEIIEKFIMEYQKQFHFPHGTIPFISLISENASNELQIYITSFDADTKKVTVSDIALRTIYYFKDNGKYIFTNYSRHSRINGG
jgi:hypothetical protein